VVFTFGFKKNDQDTIKKEALKPYRAMARIYNCLTEDQVRHALEEGKLFEVKATSKRK